MENTAQLIIFLYVLFSLQIDKTFLATVSYTSGSSKNGSMCKPQKFNNTVGVLNTNEILKSSTKYPVNFKKWQLSRVTLKHYEIVNMSWKKTKVFVYIDEGTTETNFNYSKESNLSPVTSRAVIQKRSLSKPHTTASNFEFYYLDELRIQNRYVNKTPSKRTILKNMENIEKKSTPKTKLKFPDIDNIIKSITTEAANLRNYPNLKEYPETNNPDYVTTNENPKITFDEYQLTYTTQQDFQTPIYFGDDETCQLTEIETTVSTKKPKVKVNISKRGNRKRVELNSENVTIATDRIKFFEIYDMYTSKPKSMRVKNYSININLRENNKTTQHHVEEKKQTQNKSSSKVPKKYVLHQVVNYIPYITNIRNYTKQDIKVVNKIDKQIEKKQRSYRTKVIHLNYARTSRKLQTAPLSRAPKSAQKAPISRAPKSAQTDPISRAPISAHKAPISRAPKLAEKAPISRAPKSAQTDPISRAPKSAETKYNLKSKVVKWSDYPFIAAYINNPFQIRCDAAALSAHWLMAAASCLLRTHKISDYNIEGRSAFVAYCGNKWWSPERVTYAKRTTVHPRYHPRDKAKKHLYNIGLIQVDSSMASACPKWAPISLMTHSFGSRPGGTIVSAVGWGLDRYDTRLLTTNLPKIPLSIYQDYVFSTTCPGNFEYNKAKHIKEKSGVENVYCLVLPPYDKEEDDPLHGGLLMSGGNLFAVYLQEERRSSGEQSAQYTGIWRLIPWIHSTAREEDAVPFNFHV